MDFNYPVGKYNDSVLQIFMIYDQKLEVTDGKRKEMNN